MMEIIAHLVVGFFLLFNEVVCAIIGIFSEVVT